MSGLSVRLMLMVMLCVCACGSPAPDPGPVALNAAGTPESLAFRDRALAVNGDVVVLKSTASFLEHADVERSAQQLAGVMSAEPFLYAEMIAESPHATGPVEIMVKGIRSGGATKAQLGRFMRQGTFESLAGLDIPQSIVIADQLATALGVQIGDELSIRESTANPAWQPAPAHPHVVRVSGTFHVEIEEYDRHLAYLELSVMQSLLDRTDGVTGIELRLRDHAQAPATARQLDKALGGLPYDVKDWQQLNPALVEGSP